MIAPLPSDDLVFGLPSIEAKGYFAMLLLALMTSA
jgi:hypothetical protein